MNADLTPDIWNIKKTCKFDCTLVVVFIEQIAQRKLGEPFEIPSSDKGFEWEPKRWFG